MTDFNWRGMAFVLGCGAICIGMLVILMMTAGCITAAKEIAKDAMATPTPTPTPIPTPTPSPTPTTKQTPVSIPTLEVKPVNPYLHGERSEGQWFKWLRSDVSGTKDMNVGIVAYRHKWLDKYTWWNGAMGNYQVEYPSGGNRYFAVWINQEMFGTNQTNDPRMWGMDKENFRLQYKGRLIEPGENHLPVNRILEFDELLTYYNTDTAKPFGYQILYSSLDHNEAAGMVAEPIGYLRMGPGNAIDGYLLFEVPKEAFNEDVLLLGSFSTFGTAYWRFSE
jgi:hypothetical protein